MKKKIIFLIISIVISIFFTACELDNYDEPNVFLTGKITYNGTPLNLSHNEVTLQVWEEGWEKEIPIYADVHQDGSYSVLIFKGSFILRFASGQGPFQPISDISVNLDGDKEVDIEVTPYFLVNSASFTASGQNVSVTFGANKIISDASIEKVFLFVSKSVFVDRNSAYASTELSGESITDMNSISLNLTYPEFVREQDYIFARVGIKISGVEDMIFSEVEKLDI